MNRLVFLAWLRNLKIELANINERIQILEETLSNTMDQDEVHEVFQEMKWLYEEQDRISTEIKKIAFFYLNY